MELYSRVHTSARPLSCRTVTVKWTPGKIYPVLQGITQPPSNNDHIGQWWVQCDTEQCNAVRI